MFALLLITSAIGLAGVRVESGLGMDTNVSRVEQENEQSDALFRLILDAADRVRLAQPLALSLSYHGGAKRFFARNEKDAVFQKAKIGLGIKANDWLILGVDASIRDRTTRQDRGSRDYTRTSVKPRLSLRFGRTSLTIGSGGERFYFKPNEDLSATGLAGFLAMSHRFQMMDVSVTATLMERHFEGSPLQNTAGAGARPVPVLSSGQARKDQILGGLARIRYVGTWLGELSYGISINNSNSFGAGLIRHNFQVSSTVNLSWSIVGSFKLGLQQVTYDDRQYIGQQLFVEDEGRSSVSLRFERPIYEALSVVISGGVWFSPFDSGPDYHRQTALFGLAYNEVD